ncbi:MAG: SDR family NAD(P)-dependent oxidoreductase [Solirubrobacteraceae bacterium]|nr:SDR family NAD(P)-dependent oxidoreductase [Solirubrobacteraceae bacterium]
MIKHSRSTSDRDTSRVWLITGAGRGLGLAFAQAAIEAGDRVAGTVRERGGLGALVDSQPDRVLELVADVRCDAEVRAAVEAAVAWGGRLDVVVNNAGYGLVGAIEEVSEAEAEANVSTNLLGPLRVSRAVIPHLRRQGRGHIVQISTSGAVGSMPGLGLYNAGKWGLEGFTEAMAAELEPFGIRVTIAELGGFDTDWGGSSMRFASPKPEYDALRERMFGTAEVPWPAANGPATDGGGEGDEDVAPEADDAAGGDASAAVAASALLAHVGAPDGPLRLLVGDDVAEQVAMALEARRVDYARDPRFSWPTG